MKRKAVGCLCFGLFLSSLFLAGCDGEKRPSHDEVVQIFSKQSAVMKEVVELCAKFPTLSRVGPAHEEPSFYKDVPQAEGIADAIKIIRQSLVKIPALSVNCERMGDVEGNPLAIVQFFIYATGPSVSGSSISIYYVTPWGNRNLPHRDEVGEARLSEPGWYVVELY